MLYSRVCQSTSARQNLNITPGGAALTFVATLVQRCSGCNNVAHVRLLDHVLGEFYECILSRIRKESRPSNAAVVRILSPQVCPHARLVAAEASSDFFNWDVILMIPL